MLFTVYTSTSIAYDGDTGKAAMRDATELMEAAEERIHLVAEKNRDGLDQDLNLANAVGILFVPGLFFCVLIYVGFTTYSRWKDQR